MAFPPKVERWRQFVSAELARINVPLPPELPLSLIRWESAGKTGVINESSGASGLGQFKPIAVKEYNRFHSQKISMADMRDQTERGALLQIRATVWLIAHNWRNANKYLKRKGRTSVSIDELAKIADLFYGPGPGTAQKMLNKASTPPRYEAAKQQNPTFWGIGHADKVWRLAVENGANFDASAIDSWLGSGDSIDPDPDPDPDQNQNGTLDTGMIITILIIAVGWYLLKKGGK